METIAAAIHDCNRDTRQEFRATIAEPYHFVASGLPNVFLVGVRYFRCQCGEELADIPSIKQLLNLIARDLIEKDSALGGAEIRFLRKRLGKKAADFAKQIGLEPETLSRIENDHLAPSERTDKLIRLYYAVASRDPGLLGQLQVNLDQKLMTWQRIVLPPKKIVASVTNNKWTAVAA
ncbi:MAG: helix-turn-helix domain-containing protein [Terriglobales bacterium]